MNIDLTAQDVPQEFTTAMERLLRCAAVQVVGGADYPIYMAAVRAEHERISQHYPDFGDGPVTWVMAHALWQQMPNPALDYALPTLALPGRNEACPCGSGRKFKNCCLALAQEMQAELPELNGLELLLQVLPKKRWPELAGSRVPLAMVEETVLAWREQDRPARDMIALLEPWFKHSRALGAKHEALFDHLLDAYDEAGHPRKKERLLQQAITAGDSVMRSAALQRLASMQADQGDYTAAWQSFAQAQRSNPDAVSLSHLEVTMLLAEGRTDEARARGLFWVKRLQAHGEPELAPLIAFLTDLGERGEAAMADKMLEFNPRLNALLEAFGQAPPVASLYTLDAGDESAGALQPKPALRKALAAWRECAPAAIHSPLQLIMGDDVGTSGDIQDWLPVLRQYPQLWNAFEVLDVISKRLEANVDSPYESDYALPLYERAEQLLRTVLKANGAEGKRLEWGWLENRPALSLLANRIARDPDDAVDEAQLARLEWLVLTLNPNDNQGFRDVLMRAYLHRAQVHAALALSDRYPQDFGSMRHNRVLALFAAGRKQEALDALRAAMEDAPKLTAWLLKSQPKAPALDPSSVRVGGDDEAWWYRHDTLALWQKLGAMEWLRASVKTLAKAQKGAPTGKAFKA